MLSPNPDFKRAVSRLLRARGPGVAALMGFLAVIGCGKDKTAADYEQDRLHKDIGKLQGAEGTYTGYVYSRSGGSPRGALQLILRTQLQLSGSATQLGTSVSPVLEASFEYQEFGRGTPDRSSALSETSYFEAETGNLQIDVPITRSSGRQEKLSLNGHLNGDRIEGTLAALGYSSYGGRITLNRNGAELERLVSDGPVSVTGPIQGDDPQISGIVLASYAGQTALRNGGAESARLTVLEPHHSPEESLLNLFIPVRTVQASLTLGGYLRLNYPNALWDFRAGRLTGDASLTRGSETVTVLLDCQGAGPAAPEIVCQHLTASLGAVAATHFSAAPLSAPEVGNPDTAPVEARDDSYHGEVDFDQGAVRVATLRVIHPRKTRQETLVDLFLPPDREAVKMRLKFNDAFELTVPDATLDLSSGTLFGVYSRTNGSNQSQLVLDCASQRSGGHGPALSCNLLGASENGIAHAKFYDESFPIASVRETQSDLFARTLQYAGSALYPSGERSRDAALTVTFPARTREEDLLRLIFPSAETSAKAVVSFSNGLAVVPFDVVLNRSAGTLSGNGEVMGSGERRLFTLSCSGFSEVPNGISCTYTSDRLASPIQLSF